jgi:RNA polymerase sigma-70 factor, ECF subfamily
MQPGKNAGSHHNGGKDQVTVSTYPAPAVVANGARARSQVDFDALYAAASQGLTLQLYAYLGDLDAAQATVDEVFGRALAKWKSIRRHHDPIAWISGTAWTLASKRRPRAATSPDRLIQALVTLPPAQRRVVIMQVMAQMSIEDIAAQENIKATVAGDRLRQGKSALSIALNAPKGN